jgi:uncharacterized repeat protein (TIGR01451 family)
VTSNTARYGGGLYLDSSDATLSANSVASNTAALGGGLYLSYSPATLSANSVASNTALYDGGGLYLDWSNATLSANSVASNTALYDGGGLYLNYSPATLTNTVVADNRADQDGGGLFIYSAKPRLLHTTIACNGGGDGSGVYVATGSTAWLTNTILVSHTTGITVFPGSTANMYGTLWYGNAADWGGAGTVNHTGDYTGDPAFVDPDRGDYHIGPGSAAIDWGVNAGVTADKDGRPRDAHPDLGAYEFGALEVTKWVDRNPVQAGTQLTYTVWATNTSDVALTVMAFDVLPDQVGGLGTAGLSAAGLPPDALGLLGGQINPAATSAYSTTTIAPGGTWVWLIPNLTVQPDYSGTLTNTVLVYHSPEASASYVLTSTSVVSAANTYLPLILKGSP